MMEDLTLRISAGLRVGFWKVGPRPPFQCLGHYTGPDLGDHIVGSHLKQKLMEGEVSFKVGVLFRPDLGKRQRLETILILESYIPEMFEYEDWEKANG